MTRRIKPTRRARNPAPLPAHEALAILIAYAVEGATLRREARRNGKARHAKPSGG